MLIRCGALLFQCLCIFAFFSLFSIDSSLTHQKMHFKNLTELKLQPPNSDSETAQNEKQLQQSKDQSKHERDFRIELPPMDSFMGQSILLSGYRHHIEVRIDESLLMVAGNEKFRWSHNFSPILHAPLSITSSKKEPSTDSSPHYINVHATGFGVTKALIGQVWIGSDTDIQKAADRLRLTKFYLPFATLGILLSLALFLAIDSTMSAESRKYFILTLPHLVYAVICLPEPEFVDSVLWFKLHYISVIATALFWSHFGIKELGLNNKYLDWSIVIAVLMAIPYLFMNNAIDVFSWGLGYHAKSAFLVGLAHYFYVGWMRPECNSRFKNSVFIVVGGFLAGAGASDIDGAYKATHEIRDSLVPLVSLVMTFVILTITAVNMRKRRRRLFDHQNNMMALVDRRTTELEEAQSQLLQHQRFKTLNAMGSAISHEIKNPLAALKNDFKLISLKQKAKDNPDAYPLERIDRNIHRIDNTLTVLTDYSKKQNIKTERQNISKWLADFLMEENLYYFHPTVNFDVDLENELITRFDAESLRRAVLNLVDNALNAGAGQQQLQINLSLNSKNEWIHLTIEDSGPGFEGTDNAGLCEPLVSGSATSLGLGLAIVSDIVKLHDGKLELYKSASLGGAAVTLSLPVIFL